MRQFECVERPVNGIMTRHVCRPVKAGIGGKQEKNRRSNDQGCDKCTGRGGQPPDTGASVPGAALEYVRISQSDDKQHQAKQGAQSTLGEIPAD